MRTEGNRARSHTGASFLDSAPPDFSDDSGLVLTSPPNRPGRNASGDFGGKPFSHLSLEPPISTEFRPGYSLLPLLYQVSLHDSIPVRRRSNFRLSRSNQSCGTCYRFGMIGNRRYACSFCEACSIVFPPKILAGRSTWSLCRNGPQPRSSFLKLESLPPLEGYS